MQKIGKTILIGRNELETWWKNWLDYVASKIIT